MKNKLHRVASRVSNQLLANTDITEEYLYRELITKLINDLPIKYLSQIFQFEKFDPFSQENSHILNDVTSNDFLKEKILYLRNEQCLEYEVSIKI